MDRQRANDDFRVVYDQYKGLVFNLTLSYVQNIHDAEDITQEVFVKIFRHRQKFEQRSGLETWIYRIAINASLDFLKARQTKRRFAIVRSLFNTGNNEPLPQSGHFDHPGVLLENKEAIKHIFRQINTLPDRQKTVVILSVMEGKTHGEIAGIMETTPKAVESLLGRARISLSKKLESNAGDSEQKIVK